MVQKLWDSAYVSTAHVSVWHKISYPALALKASSHNVAALSWVNLLSSRHNKGNLTLGALSCLEKVAIMINLFYWLIFWAFCAVLHCMVAASTFWGLWSTYTIGFRLKNRHTTTILFWNSAKIFMLRPLAVKLNYLFLAIKALLLLV